jgi:hypothetical protein
MALAVLAGLAAAPAAAQDDGEPACAFLCAPELKIEPTFTVGARPPGRRDASRA